MMGLPEVLIFLVAAASICLFFVAPVIGIQRARRRREAKTGATAPVILATVMTVLASAVLLTGGSHWVFRALSLVLNIAWLWLSVSANRQAKTTIADPATPNSESAVQSTASSE